MDLENYFQNKIRNDYQRDYFDSFLKKIGFNYNIPSIHIAGTNGKGSTANYLASIYQNSGYKVGLFTSPSLIRINEMIKINDEEISNQDIEHYINANHKFIEKFNLSAFEIQTFIALSYFQDKKVDIAIIECGMGGETDATNVFVPILSIITSVSLEHTMFLGRTISEIALQKCGIIKDEVPVVLGSNDEDVVNVVNNYARDLDSKVYSVVEPSNVVYGEDGYTFTYINYIDVHIPSIASYSVKDACIALESITVLSNSFPVKEEAIYEGLNNVKMAARMDVKATKPLVIVDGGHNPEAISNLTQALGPVLDNRPLHIVFATFRDKNIARMLAILGEISNDITLTTFDHPRARTYEEYFLFAEDYHFEEDAVNLIKTLIAQYPDDVIVITGSLAFAGYITNLFNEGVFNER